MLNVIKLEKDKLNDAIKIWNDVVQDGNAFPQTELLDTEFGYDFFALNLSPESLLIIIQMKLSDFTFCIPITSEDAGTYQTQVLLSYLQICRH